MDRDSVDLTASAKLDAFILQLQKTGIKVQRQNTRDSDVTGSDVTGCSDNDGEETPLSHAEESAIEECLNDTEGSLSNVDLNIFDDISDDLPVHRTRKTRGQRTSERANMDFRRSGTDCESSSLDEVEAYRRSSLTEINLDNPISMLSEAGKITPQQVETARQATTQNTRSFSQENIKRRKMIKESVRKYLEFKKKKIVRRKTRHSPPIRKNDETHIHSFFSAMADLVSTFPDEDIVTAKLNVYIIMGDTLAKLKEWYDNDDPKNPKHGFKFDHSEYRSLQRKLAELSLTI